MTRAPSRRLEDSQFTLCCLTVLAALLPHATWLPQPFLIVLLVLIVLRWIQRRRWPRPWPWWFRTGLMLALVAAAWTSIGTISGTQGAGFLAAMLVSKLFEAERVRDARSIATFASFLVMAQFLFHTELWAMLTGVPGMVLTLTTLASVNQRLPTGLTAWRRPLATAAALLLVSLPIAVLAFAAFPRLDAPLWGHPGGFQRGELGLSDRMEPGQIGSVALDDRPAMRVRFPDGPPPPASQRYFRGLTLWTTDGRSWIRPPWMQGQLNDLPPVPDHGIRQEITMERDAAPWLPALDRPIAAPPGMYFALDSSLPLPRRRNELRYEVTSNPELTLDPFALRPFLRSLALELPADRNPRTLALARQLRAEHPDDRAFANRLLTLFHGEFGYSLEPPPLGAHAVDEFMFDTLSGYCEHYAAAYATLLRAGGVPARVVLGYQGGYWNAIGDHLVVRRADAHAWVELWIEGQGWLRADPTAMVAPERIERGGDILSSLDLGFRSRGPAARWLRDRWDFLEMRWTDWIVNYRVADQTALLQRLLDRLPHSFALSWRLLSVGGGILLAFLLWFIWRNAATTGPSDPLARWLARFRRVLAGAGVTSTGAEPVSSLTARAGDRFPELAPALRGLAERYQGARYGSGDTAAPTAMALLRLRFTLLRLRLRRLISG